VETGKDRIGANWTATERRSVAGAAAIPAYVDATVGRDNLRHTGSQRLDPGVG
jgi:hypothetical protein